MRRVQPNKTDTEKTALPKPASVISMSDTEAVYESIYSRIDEVVPASILARGNSFPRFAAETRQDLGGQNSASGKPEEIMMSDIEPLYATVDEVFKTISQDNTDNTPKDDGGDFAESAGELPLEGSQNGRAQDHINDTKDALAIAMLYAKIDVTKTIRYRLKMAQMLKINNNNNNTSSSHGDGVTNIQYVNNVLYETMTSPENNRNIEPKVPNEIREQNVDTEMEGCREVRCENVDGRSKTNGTNIAADGNNNKEEKHELPDVSPYETIPADIDNEGYHEFKSETDDSLNGGLKTDEMTDVDFEKNKYIEIHLKNTKEEAGSEERSFTCCNENQNSMRRMFDATRTERPGICGTETNGQTSETSL